MEFGTNCGGLTSEVLILLMVGGYIMLNGLLALISLALTAGSFYFYRNSGGTTMYFVAVVVFLILTLIFGGLFLSGRMNKTEEIHITE